MVITIRGRLTGPLKPGRRSLRKFLLVLCMSPSVVLAQVDGANVIRDVQEGFAWARECEKSAVQSALDLEACVALQSQNLPPRGRIKRQAFYFHVWLQADEAVARGVEGASVLASAYAARLNEEKGRSKVPLKLFCRLAAADCTSIEFRLPLDP